MLVCVSRADLPCSPRIATLPKYEQRVCHGGQARKASSPSLSRAKLTIEPRSASVGADTNGRGRPGWLNSDVALIMLPRRWWQPNKIDAGTKRIALLIIAFLLAFGLSYWLNWRPVCPMAGSEPSLPPLQVGMKSLAALSPGGLERARADYCWQNRE